MYHHPDAQDTLWAEQQQPLYFDTATSGFYYNYDGNDLQHNEWYADPQGARLCSDKNFHL